MVLVDIICTYSNTFFPKVNINIITAASFAATIIITTTTTTIIIIIIIICAFTIARYKIFYFIDDSML
jgi:ABC-type maltose transport system permease subunit